MAEIGLEGWMLNLPNARFQVGQIVKIKGSGVVGRIADHGCNVQKDSHVYSVRDRDGLLHSFVEEQELSLANLIERKWFQFVTG